MMLAETSGFFNGGAYLTSDRSGVSVPVPTAYSGYTIEAWVNRQDANRCEAVVTSGYRDFLSGDGFWFGLCNGGRPYFQSNVTAGTAHTGNTPIPANVWTHLAVTWSAFEERFYVNGELDAVTASGAEPNRNKSRLYVGAEFNESFGGGPVDRFYGNISEARVWQTVRSQDEIRRSMHELIEGQPTGLLAAWHLNSDSNDSANNLPTTNTTVCICGPVAPPVFRVSEVDANFNRLPSPRFFGAGAYVPGTNTAYLIGGYDANYAVRSDIFAMDMSTGNTTAVANLPFAAGSQTAAFVPVNNSIYIFGGDIQNVPQNTIVKFDPTTNAVTQLAATLPTPLYFGNAVWHAGIQRIVLVGGYNGGALDSIVLFDPATETASLAAVTLPEGRYNAAVSYSPMSNRVYVFGGNDNAGFSSATRTTWELDIQAEGSGAVTPLLGADLPLAHTFATAVEDPETHLIHILGGTAEYVQTFDPRTGKSWRTMQRMPRNYENSNANGLVLNTPYQTVVYSPRNRHALVIGGGNYGAAPTRKVWRIPLGDGPAIPIERWDFVNDLSGVIDGDDRGVFVSGNGINIPVTRIDDNGNRASFGYFGGSINDIAYSPSTGLWVASSLGAYQFNNGPTEQYATPEFGTPKVYSVQPEWPTFGTDRGLKIRNLSGGYNTYFHPNTTDIVWSQTGTFGETWSIVRDKSPIDAGGGRWRLGHVYSAFNPQLGTFSIQSAEFQSVCGDASPWSNVGLEIYNDLVQDHAGNLWVVGTGQGTQAVCLLSASTLSGTPSGGLATSLNGNNAMSVDVDADNRVWVGLDSTNSASGGLTVYDANKFGSLRNTDYNWLNAPIGSRSIVTGGPAPLWASGITSVAGVDEKVWAAKENGGLVTVAQRWEQVDEFLSNQLVFGIWTAAGRTFFDLGSDLYVLEPDGLTFDHRGTLGNQTHVVASDGAGHIWMGSQNGPRLYLPTGYDDLTDRVGVRPSGNVHAIVEAADDNPSDGKAAPVWLGGDDGLTLFDRNRFVTTFTSANSGLPATTVKSILVDSAGNIWAGTTAGLARLSADMMTWTTFTTANGLPNNSIFDLAQLGNGSIAISTANGLSLYNGNTFATQSPPVAAVNLPLSVDNLGRLWAGSALLTAAGWQGYWSTNSGLKYSTVSDTATDGADRIWFSHGPNPGVSVRGTFLPPLKDFTPVITGFSPASGSTGTTMTINGLELGSDPSEVVVTVGGSPVDILSVTESQVRVQLRDMTTSGAVSLTRSGKPTTATELFCAVPVVRSFTPTGGSAGVQVRVTGANFDPDAKLRFSGGQPHSVRSIAGTVIEGIVQSDDGSGTLTVDNHCAGATDVSDRTFRRVTVSIPEIVLNQGMSFYGIVQDKPTLIQSYISTNGTLLLGETIEVDELQLAITGPSGFTTIQNYRYGDLGVGLTPPSSSGPPSDADRMDIANSMNVSPVSLKESGVTEVKVVLRRRGNIVAQRTASVTVAPNHVTRVLLVPFMLSGSAPEDLRNMRDDLDASLAELRRRIMPFGTVEFDWSPEVVYESETFSLNRALILWDKGHAMDRARRHWNDSHISSRDVSIAFGIVDTRLIAAGSRPGYAFQTDVSEVLNTLGLDVIDTLCDVGDAILSVFDLSDGTGCSLDVPTAVGWAAGGPLGGISTGTYKAGIAATIGHEIGHINGLVRPYAYNGSYGDNVTHSVNDEIGGDKTCTDASVGPVDFDWAKTLYNQPGVRGPVVNALAGPNAAQLRPQPEGNWNTLRAKAIMSYACKDDSNRVFYEPVDLLGMSVGSTPFVGLLQAIPFVGPGSPADNASTAPFPRAASPGTSSSASSPTPVPNPGPRLHVSGLVNAALATGEIRQAEVFGESGPLTPGFSTDVYLVQLDAEGTELARLGVFPILASEPDGDLTGFFAATMVRQAGLSQIELRLGPTLLDTFTAGSELPIVAITGPLAGEEFIGDSFPVSFTATDVDGDNLSIVVEYSNDDGAAWTPVANATESGTVTILSAWLAGAEGTARVRISASDGLNTSSATSEAFTVAAHPPLPYIAGAEEGGFSLEGQHVSFSGGAVDNQDRMVADENLRWTSDVEGLLGTGDEISAPLYGVGWHNITLEATNSRGLTATTTYAVYVAPDYDFDGIADAVEIASGINPLSPVDAYSDADGDGLSYIVELHRGLDASNADSDSDGRTDDIEVVDGTNPLGMDNPPAPDQLAITPTSITLAVDLSDDTPLPQQTIGILSRGAADWTVATNVDWLESSANSGMTPASMLLRVRAYDLVDGAHTAELTFNSVALGQSVTIPLTVTVANRMAWFDVLGDGQSTTDDCSSIQARVGAAFADLLYDYHYDVDRDGLIESADVATCNQALGATASGDFEPDGDIDADDIDLLFAAIRQGSVDALFDLNGDQLVDDNDVTTLVEVILGTRRGDANLDGSVNRGDLAILSANYGGAGGWARGDFSGDQRASLVDIAILQANLDPAAPSPRPAGMRAFRILPAVAAAVLRDAPPVAKHDQRMLRVQSLRHVRAAHEEAGDPTLAVTAKLRARRVGTIGRRHATLTELRQNDV